MQQIFCNSVAHDIDTTKTTCKTAARSTVMQVVCF